jgi:crotonobetainyl-CoA:carnitine CoA-transferase CaiB-like acyl-CoA transferase
MAGVVPRLSETPGAVRHTGRDVGQDSRSVLRELLDLSDGRIDELAQAGVVATRETAATQ